MVLCYIRKVRNVAHYIHDTQKCHVVCYICYTEKCGLLHPNMYKHVVCYTSRMRHVIGYIQHTAKHVLINWLILTICYASAIFCLWHTAFLGVASHISE